ncbi:MATE efflux family protein, expressed [Zostera marina]|uniref:Protein DETOXIFICATION n=1 Tax=Zostera marina TaxID=29655 RepID=A0A0K9PBD1_ZOSMR|nr:MATE efflux family protein, expressed [Zostera marina]
MEKHDSSDRLLSNINVKCLTLRSQIWKEKKKLWVVAGPAIFNRFSTFGVSIISMAFMGHIGAIELAGYSLAFTVTVRFSCGVLLGMASALETLCGQSYGAGQYHMLGIYLQRSWLVLIPFIILLLPFYILTTPILTFLGQDKAVANAAGVMSLWFIPTIGSYAMSYTLQMYLQSQSKNNVITYWAAATLLIHFFLCWLLVMRFHYGATGVMLSTVVALWIPVFGQLFFVFCGGCPEMWKGFDIAAFYDLWPVVKLSTSSGFMVWLEVCYNTILVLLTGHMTDAEVAIDALSICVNIGGWELMVAFGLMAAIGVRVANELGAGNAKAAKFSICVVLTTSFTIGTVFFFVFLLLRGNIAYLFTRDQRVATTVADLSPLLAFNILLNALQPIFSGAGWQRVVAYVNLGCYYLIGIPLGIVLVYELHLGVKGVWMGMIIGVTAQTFLLICITWKTNWESQVVIAQARVRKWFLPTHPIQEDDSV